MSSYGAPVFVKHMQFFFSSSFDNYLANSQMWPDTAPEILEMSDDDVNYDGWPWPYSDYYL